MRNICVYLLIRKMKLFEIGKEEKDKKLQGGGYEGCIVRIELNIRRNRVWNRWNS